jgi:O-antigen ligase
MVARGRRRRAALPVNFLVPAALALFVPATYQAIRALGPRRGVLAALLGGWLFLPVFEGHLSVPYAGSKMTFVSTVVLAVALAVDYRSFARVRLRWADLPALTMCLGPFATALSNDLGPNEAASSALASTLAWGAPYLLGRAYLGDPRGVRAFATSLVVASLVYAPLCLWEVRMSPQLHRQVYGYATFDSFAFAVRFGGYRPTVFMHFGLMVGMFMAGGALACWWLWRSGALARIGGVHLKWWTGALVVTTVLVKATGAVILLAVGIAVLEVTRRLRRPGLVLVLALLPAAFAGARIAGWTAGEVAHASGLVDKDREQSVAFRFAQEERLLDKALQRPWLGWGRFGRSRLYDEDGKDLSITDSQWIISLGMSGIVGLASLGLMLLVPTLQLVRRYPVARWGTPAVAPAAALSLVTSLWAVDCLLNAMTSPVFPAICGSLSTFVAGRWSRRRRVAVAREVAGPPMPPAVPAA